MIRFKISPIFLLLLSGLLLSPALCAAQEGQVLASPTTGMEALVENVVLPGSELEPKALPDTNAPLVLRVVRTFPYAGGLRYDFAFYGLVPGSYDLADFLQRKDGTAADGLPPIPVEVIAVRPIGELVRPGLELESPPRVGGYKLALMIAGIFWLAVMGLLLFGFRKKSAAQLAARVPPVTLADQLRPLVKQAQAGELSQSGQAELERTLLKIWRKRLNLEDADPAEAIIQLRKEGEAGALLRELEKWLHKPGAAGDVDVAELLKPYEKLPAEEG